MSRGVRVVGGGDGRAIQDVDLFIFAIGYEARSRYAIMELHGRFARGLGIRFGEHEELSFQENLDWASSQESVSIVEARSRFDVASAVEEALALLGGVDRQLHVAFDVSSFSRANLAAAYSALSEFSGHSTPVLVDFVYSFAEYTDPPENHGPVIEFGAVGAEFAGIGDAGLGLATVIGLGYESELALSAQQVLDPAVTWLAVPVSPDEQFDEKLKLSNDVLLNMVDARNIWTYRVDDPYSTFVELEAVVHGLSRSNSVVLVPLGPKLFVVACLLVASVHDNAIGVWRLSPGGLRTPREQRPSGKIASVSAMFGEKPRPTT